MLFIVAASIFLPFGWWLVFHIAASNEADTTFKVVCIVVWSLVTVANLILWKVTKLLTVLKWIFSSH